MPRLLFLLAAAQWHLLLELTTATTDSRHTYSIDEYTSSLQWCSDHDSVDVRAFMAPDQLVTTADGSLKRHQELTTLTTTVLGRCGYVKLKNCLAPALVADLRNEILQYLKHHPTSPLINSLRGQKSGNVAINGTTLPWDGGSTRAELGLPFEVGRACEL